MPDPDIERPDIEWTGGDLPTFVTHLECGLTGERYAADVIQGLSKAGRPLLVRYDLDGVRRALTKEMLAARPQTLWRYREMLPVRRPGNVVSLGEIVTPLVRCRASPASGNGRVFVTNEDDVLRLGAFAARCCGRARRTSSRWARSSPRSFRCRRRCAAAK